MAIEIPDLSGLDQDFVDQAFAYAVQLLAEKRPNIDTRFGVIGNLILNADGILGGARRTNWDRLRRSLSLLEIEKDPSLADDDVVDGVLSNWNVTRQQAAEAQGEVTIVLDSLVAFTVAAGEVFIGNGKRFVTETAFAGRTDSANVLTSTDRAIVQIGDNEWAFTIEVVAEEAGTASMLRKNDPLVPESASSAFVRAFATNDFTSGANLQTNAQLLDELQEGPAVQAYSNRITNGSLVRKSGETGFSTILAMSTVGMNDPEMTRDQHWLFPVSGGGRTDIYLRSQALPQSVSLTKTATLIDVEEDGGIWQLSLLRDDAPGFYEISKIRLPSSPETDAGYEVVEDIRGLDLTGDDLYLPDLETTLEGVYSRYQAATIRFLDTDTDTASLTVNSSKQQYEVTAVTMPLVKELQAFIGARKRTNPGGDHLVKGAVPCFLTLNFEIQRRRTPATIDTEAIKNDLADYVNGTKFPGKLYAAALARIIDEQLPDDVDCGAVDMFGRIRRPDGFQRFIRADDVLTVPDEPGSYSTGRTVAFFLDPAAIGISVVDVEVPAV